MLTDLSKFDISQINEALIEDGYEARVLEMGEGNKKIIGEKYFGYARQAVDILTERLNVNAKIFICYVEDDNESFQAWACKLRDNEYCIAIWLSAAFRTITTISQLMGTAPVAAHLNYNLKNYISRTDPLAHDTFSAFEALSLQSKVNFDDTLEKLCMEIAFTAIEWLIYHEFGHIVNGHCDLSGRELNGMKFIREDSPNENKDMNLTSQALELDADCFATLILMQAILHRPLSFEHHLQTDNDVVKETFRLKCFVFCIFAIVRGFDHEPFEVDRMFDTDHPPGAMRMVYMLELIAAMVMDGNIPFKAENVAMTSFQTLVILEEAISQATGVMDGEANFAHVWDSDPDAFNVPVRSRWSRLHPALERLKLGDAALTPPHYPPA